MCAMAFLKAVFPRLISQRHHYIIITTSSASSRVVISLIMRRNENCDVDVQPDETSVRRLFHQAKLSWGLQRRRRSQHPHGGNMRRSQRRSIKALTLLIAVWTLTFWVYVYCFFLENVSQSLQVIIPLVIIPFVVIPLGEVPWQLPAMNNKAVMGRSKARANLEPELYVDGKNGKGKFY